MLFLVSSMVNPAHRTSPLLYPSVGGWVGRDTERRAMTYLSLGRTKTRTNSKPCRMAVYDLWTVIERLSSGSFYLPAATRLPLGSQQDEVLENPLSLTGWRLGTNATVTHWWSDHTVQEVVIVHPVNKLTFPDSGMDTERNHCWACS